jgi:phosphatidylcholine synthase
VTHRQLSAWLVHLYTISGGVFGMLALFAAAEGEIRTAFLLLVVSMLIDATDGILARRVRVRDVLPNFDGAEVDNIIDALTYGWIPIFIMGSQGLLPHLLWVMLPVIALCYAYGQVNMKTPDAFFLGFPSYWNIVALYLFWLRPAPPVAILMVVIPTVLTFIPTRYLYPSKNQMLWRVSWGLGAVWFTLVIGLLLQTSPNPALVSFSLFYPVYYMVASFYVDWRLRQRQRLNANVTA